MKNKVIALTGAKGSGKDTVAQHLLKTAAEFGYNAKTIAFADPIKNVIQHIFKLDPSNNDDYDRLKRSFLEVCGGSHKFEGNFLWKSVDGRHVVREIGMLMRSYDDDQFNQYVLRNIEKERDVLWIVTDLRFKNELILLRNLSASIVKINREGVLYDGHVTEVEFQDTDVDYVLLNDELNALEQKVHNLFLNIEKEF